MFVIIGSTTADLLVMSEQAFDQSGADGFRGNNLVFTERPLTILLGGNGGNSAYVLAGLGAPTALCSAVGQDPLGDLLVSWLETRQVNLAGLTRSPDYATSSSTILMADAAHQRVFHHLGATQAVCPENIPGFLLTQAEILLISSFPILTGMRSGGGYAAVLSAAHQAGVLTAVDLGPAIGQPVTMAELGPLLPHLDYLMANVHELAVLTGGEDWEQAGDQLLAAGAARLVIKRGRDGASGRGPNLRVDVPGFAVKAHISVGAGDSFNVGFLYGLQQGWPLAQALRFGNAVAALVVSGERGVLSAPARAEVDQFLADHPYH
ncbi:MAG: carbohydrate kinase family protein [Chloroflexota bacterium]